jgi:hypothetical protein
LSGYVYQRRLIAPDGAPTGVSLVIRPYQGDADRRVRTQPELTLLDWILFKESAREEMGSGAVGEKRAGVNPLFRGETSRSGLFARLSNFDAAAPGNDDGRPWVLIVPSMPPGKNRFRCIMGPTSAIPAPGVMAHQAASPEALAAAFG